MYVELTPGSFYVFLIDGSYEQKLRKFKAAASGLIFLVKLLLIYVVRYHGFFTDE